MGQKENHKQSMVETRRAVIVSFILEVEVVVVNL